MANDGIQNPWKIALTAVLVEGIIFIILSFFKFRETLVNKTPQNLKYGISAGIGLFIVIVGLKDAGITIADGSTLVTLGDLSTPQVVLAFVGFLIIAALHNKNVPGDILIGILATWFLGMLAQAAGWYNVDTAAGAGSLFPDFSGGLVPAAPLLFKFDFGYVFSHTLEFLVIVFSFLFVDLFDTVGTVIGVADKGDMLDENGELPRVGAVLMADAIGTVAGACLGPSTVSSYVESSAGVAQGGRTGLTALTTGILFVIAIILSPIFLAIPSFATTPALLFVGLLMLSSIKKMAFDGDIADVVSGFTAIIMMPFTYSIANGIMFGILAWVILKICTGKIKDIHPIMWVLAALFVLRIITLVI